MFKCEVCGQTAPPRTQAQKVAVEFRDRAYPVIPLMYEPSTKRWLKAKAKSRRLRRHRLDDEEKVKWEWQPDPGGHGLEIVREVTACPACAQHLRAHQSDSEGLTLRRTLPEPVKVIPVSSSARVASSRASA